MEILVLIASISILNYLWFNLGVKMTQKVSKGEEIETPELNPVKVVNKVITEQREKEEAKAEKEKLETILRNIERYDGTSSHQEDVPMN